MLLDFRPELQFWQPTYEQESGEKWTPEKQKELFDLMSKEQNFDALKVEEKFLAPVREKKARVQEVEELAKKRAEEILKERGISSGYARWRR